MFITYHSHHHRYQMMLACWADEPTDRLPFSKISSKLGKLLETASVRMTVHWLYIGFVTRGIKTDVSWPRAIKTEPMSFIQPMATALRSLFPFIIAHLDFVLFSHFY